MRRKQDAAEAGSVSIRVSPSRLAEYGRSPVDSDQPQKADHQNRTCKRDGGITPRDDEHDSPLRMGTVHQEKAQYGAYRTELNNREFDPRMSAEKRDSPHRRLSDPGQNSRNDSKTVRDERQRLAGREFPVILIEALLAGEPHNHRAEASKYEPCFRRTAQELVHDQIKCPVGKQAYPSV